MRIDAFISQNSDYSRKDIQKLIKQNRVTLNGNIVNKGQTVCFDTDTVAIDQTSITKIPPRYFMLHKPKGYVCANSDAEHPTVLDLIREPQKQLLQIAGRLDLDTTGLVLLTDDGDWNHQVTSPKKLFEKCYRVTTADVISQDVVDLFKIGILLRSEDKPTLPAKLDLIDTHHANLYICEGKYHQVKRMFAATGNKVIELHRHQIGKIVLDPLLSEGEYRSLTPTEFSSFM